MVRVSKKSKIEFAKAKFKHLKSQQLVQVQLKHKSKASEVTSTCRSAEKGNSKAEGSQAYGTQEQSPAHGTQEGSPAQDTQEPEDLRAGSLPIPKERPLSLLSHVGTHAAYQNLKSLALSSHPCLLRKFLH